MRSIYFILLLLIISCKKEVIREVQISGNIVNVINGNPMPGIKLKLVKQPKYRNQSLSGNIVHVLESDASGNFNFSELLSDRFHYILQIVDDSLWQEYPGAGFNYRDTIDPDRPVHLIQFKSAPKTYLRFNFISHTGSSWQDTLRYVHYMANGNAYYQSKIYITDLYYLNYSTSTLFQGMQRTDFTFTKNGQDSTFTRYYILTPGETKIMDIDLY